MSIDKKTASPLLCQAPYHATGMCLLTQTFPEPQRLALVVHVRSYSISICDHTVIIRNEASGAQRAESPHVLVRRTDPGWSATDLLSPTQNQQQPVPSGPRAHRKAYPRRSVLSRLQHPPHLVLGTHSTALRLPATPWPVTPTLTLCYPRVLPRVMDRLTGT